MTYIHLFISLLLVYLAAAQSAHAASKSHGHSLTKRDAPVPSANGVCYTYTIQRGDTCAKIAERHQITTSNIETWNIGAWGWSGCDKVKQGDFVCLSSGALPMPVALPRATCGPQVPGTRRPGNYVDLASLNPCSSNQCCGRLGECGTTSTFCDASKGCISNCGVKSAPKENTVNAAPSKMATSKKTTLQATTSKTTVAKATSKTTTERTTEKSTLKTTSKSTASKTTSKSTSKKTTSKPKTTEKPMVTMTSIKVVTESKTKSSFNPEHSWQVTIYEDDKCKGDYFSVQGHESQEEGNCLVFKDNKKTKISDETTSCRWWTDGGLHWDTCSTSKLVVPRSWYITKGQCLFFKGKHCKDEDWLGQTYPPAKGCQSGKSGFLSPQIAGYMVTQGAGEWGSMQCFWTETWAT
ncbi:Peptidoglycan-binding Lysin subgroup [Penicillium cf. griseofulvum]|uniref:Peptidoglycan-binding Lysin subgroup n=1 Tax=Penicillium cf. griseofulvum TaxID=2972120 RepID=A0A9W9IWJ0_9EURO|nr:Peptidoglycan-binding Lysin subgroup [Penicillium cf. griseofulvum]KAJ5429501.1 Peptidoglycan-binding Lysin subgroup [Penicillium cf. griseofulvum]KAJ5436718.1 Peptidoglycan-binding Lysin subgroup [Penicillium cf. griseofulvum]